MDEHVMSADEQYISDQLFKISPLPILGGRNGQFKIKFWSDIGHTNTMDLTNEQFRFLERYLTGVPVEHIINNP